jgi:hypothetical protein
MLTPLEVFICLVILFIVFAIVVLLIAYINGWIVTTSQSALHAEQIHQSHHHHGKNKGNKNGTETLSSYIPRTAASLGPSPSSFLKQAQRQAYEKRKAMATNKPNAH